MFILSTDRVHALLTDDQAKILPPRLQTALAEPTPLYRIETPYGIDHHALTTHLVLPGIGTTCGFEKKIAVALP